MVWYGSFWAIYSKALVNLTLDTADCLQADCLFRMMPPIDIDLDPFHNLPGKGVRK